MDSQKSAVPPGIEWPAYGGPGAIRYSGLAQITRDNVGLLQVAWTFDPGEGAGGTQTQPLVVDRVLYAVTAKHNVVALNAETGKQIWRFESGVSASGANRGLVYWSSGTNRRIFAGVSHFIYALDCVTGKPIPSFGIDGRIDLRENLGRDPAKQSIALTTPGVIYKDLLIVGGRTSEGLPASPGDIRAYDVRTGKLRWSFHTIPHPGEPGYASWPKYSWKVSGSANNWSGMTVDHELGIVFVPTGSAADDFYGADRLGDNLFANTLLALDANTGKRIWHFQAVRHDLWDRDFPSPPCLVRIKRDGKTIDAVAQTTKSGHVYVFDRKTGQSLFPIEYKDYPVSTVPGEVASRSQPLPTNPAPFARQRLTEQMLTSRTPEAHKWAVEKFRSMVSDGQFVPPRVGKDTVVFPGFDGGAEWGGPAYDPVTGLLYINSNEMAWTAALAKSGAGNSARQLYFRNCARCHGDTMTGSPPQIPSLQKMAAAWNVTAITKIVREGSGHMPAFPTLSSDEVRAIATYVLSGESKDIQPDEPAAVLLDYRFTGYIKFLDPDGYPAIAPPWGTLNALDLNTGKYVWQIPFGEYPDLVAKGMSKTGSENYGGPVVTAGGLLFIGATNYDQKFRAFDKATGKLLWEMKMPASCNSTPAIYMAGGRQFVLICSEGSKGREGDPKAGTFVAFALPSGISGNGAVVRRSTPK